ncbi:hypothetical protein I4U23_016228 [Adineta vaga]|nr:hypothetical protein I4U23_016228 [Adineta vaga]
MSSSQQQQQQSPYPPPDYGSDRWQTDPFNLAPAANAKPFDNGRGNGQQTSHKEQTYTLPGGTTTYTEWSG